MTRPLDIANKTMSKLPLIAPPMDDLIILAQEVVRLTKSDETKSRYVLELLTENDALRTEIKNLKEKQ